MQTTKSLIIGAGLGALISLSVAGAADAQQAPATTTPVKPHKARAAKKAKRPDAQKMMTEQVQRLQGQVEALQRRLDVQSAAEQQTQATANQAVAQAAAANAQAATATAATQAIPAEVKTAVDLAKPKTDKIYYKGVTVTLGGFAAFETIYRSHNETSDIGSTFSAIPYSNNAVGNTRELRFTARQSRLSTLVQGDVDPYTHLGFYGEFDFQAAAQTANSTETNSYNPRIRNLYGSIDWDTSGVHLLAGQNWSLVTMNSKGITPRNEVLPPTVDSQYVVGYTWARQPQIRLTKDFDKTVWIAVSAENPQTTFYTGANGLPAGTVVTYNAQGANSAAAVTSGSGFSGFNSVNTLSLNHIPDVVAKVAFEPMVAERNLHLEVYGLYRSFYERLNYKNADKSGTGVGAGLMIPIVPAGLDFQVSGLAGKGIGRYGSGQLTDVTFNQAGAIKPISEVMALAGLTLHATPKFDIYLFAGEEKASAEAYDSVSAAGTVTGYGYGNPLYVNTGCRSQTAPGACVANNRKIEEVTLGFWHRPYVGAYGRIQYGVQLAYAQRQAFAGTGGYAPIANENMAFVSFRYYPF